MKKIISKYRHLADSSMMLSQLHDYLKILKKDYPYLLINVIEQATQTTQLTVGVQGSGTFHVRHINGEYQIGRDRFATTLSEAKRAVANKLGQIMYGIEKYHNFH